MDVSLTTADFLRRARVTHADRVGIVDEPGASGSLGTLTYAEIGRRADGMIAALDRMGVGRGERVAIVAPNCAKLLIALYAVTGSGRVLVPINFRLGAAEVQYIVDDCEAALLLVDPQYDASLASLAVPRRLVLDGDQDAELFAEGPAQPDAAVDERDAATINYTSGTTAAPKGVVLSHRSHWVNAVAVGQGFGLRPDDRYLHALPIFHVNGWGVPLAAAASGVPNVIQREIRGPEILNRVAEHGITLLCGATPVADAIRVAAQERRDSGAAVPGERTTRMVSGGAPTPPAVIEAFERVTGWELIHAYGLTETGPVLTVNRLAPELGLEPAERAARLGHAGRPVLGVELRIAADGEVQARTAKAMSGYWRRERETAAVLLPDGWVATGDGGTFDDGELRITDRKKDVIVSGGENVSSSEVEAVLRAHRDVVDCAVVGVPHERWGETPKAFVVMTEGGDRDEAALIAFCRERLAGFKAPTSVEWRDELPRTATGKVQKFRLRAPYWP